jgi:hypothetical protein
MSPLLRLHIMVYAGPSLKANEAHVAFCVTIPGNKVRYFIFHATEDPSTENEMVFERRLRDKDPRGTKTTHQSISLDTFIPKNSFEKLCNNLSATPVPRPRSNGWNCQSWVHEAMMNMEYARFLKNGLAQRYYDEMMSIIAANTTAEGINTG